MKYPSDSNDFSPIWATVAPIKAPTPIGANCMTQFVTLNITSATASKRSIIICPFCPIAAVPRPKNTENKITCSMLLSDNDAKKLVGTISIIVAQIPPSLADFAVDK